MLILITLIVLGAVVFALGFRERWAIGAICPKCLQEASITMVKIAGIPLFKRTIYSQHVHLPSGWSARTASGPDDIHPGMYTEIFGKECSHELKRGGFGATCSFFFFEHVHKDGAFSERRLYQPRVEAITALYWAFKNVPNKSLAKMTYARIDSALPMNDDERLQEVHAIQRLRQSGSISDQELERHCPEAFPMLQAIEKLRVFTTRLAGVESDEQWANLLRDLDEELERSGPWHDGRKSDAGSNSRNGLSGVGP